MFKKMMLALAPVVMIAGSALAGDDVLDQFANLDATAINDAVVNTGDEGLSFDLDNASSSADELDQVDAIESAFRRYGGHHGGSYGYQHRNYCYPSYNYGYQHHYTYYNVYRPVYHCSPVVYSTCYTPCYTAYWGCY